MFWCVSLGEYRYFTGTYNHFLEPDTKEYIHQAKFYNDENVAIEVAKLLRNVILTKHPEINYGRVQVHKVDIK